VRPIRRQVVEVGKALRAWKERELGKHLSGPFDRAATSWGKKLTYAKKEAEQTQVHPETDAQQELPPPVRRAVHSETDGEVDRGAQHDETQEAPVPPPVEQVAQSQNDEVLGPKVPVGAPVDSEGDRKEYEERE